MSVFMCPACGRKGRHYVPPSLGEPGFFSCETDEIAALRARVREVSMSDKEELDRLYPTECPAKRIGLLEAEIAALRAKLEHLERVVEAAYLEGYGQGTADEPGYDEARFYKVRVQRAWEKSKARLALDAGKEEGV